MVLVGTENGGSAGMRGHLYALDASDGSVMWSFAGTAGPGQPGHRSWAGSSCHLAAPTPGWHRPSTRGSA